MSSEIERKFLLLEAPVSLSEAKAVRIEQGYLAIEEKVDIRLRRAEEARLLTAKRGHGECGRRSRSPWTANSLTPFRPLTTRSD
jgi:CYTH domain-containing protein